MKSNGGKEERMYSSMMEERKGGHTRVSPGYLKGTRTTRNANIARQGGDGKGCTQVHQQKESTEQSRCMNKQSKQGKASLFHTVNLQGTPCVFFH